MDDDTRRALDDLRRLSEELERERSRLVMAQAVAKIGSWETDLKTLNVVWSDETYRIFGLNRAAYSPTHDSFLSFVHPDDREVVDVAFRASYTKRSVCHIEHRIIAADGSQKYVDERWETFLDSDGTPARAAGTCQDITERRRLAEHHQRAQRLESLGTLASGIAHDLNNVLTPILASIELLRIEDVEVERERLLQTMEASAMRGAELVRQVLAFARGSDGTSLPISASAVVRDVTRIVGDSLPKHIVLRTTIADDLWPFHGDPSKVHQVLMNLTVNARDAMPNGGVVTIEVTNEKLDDVYAGMHPHARPGRFVKFTVRDSGVGIAPAVIGRIFEPFFTTKVLEKGTGLGLSTVHSVAKSHGGFVSVYSEQGKGARFSVYFPISDVAAPIVEAPSADPNVPRGNGELILVVDDEGGILDIVRRTLERHGYRVRTATNGAAGVAAFVEQRADIAVVLTDMAMPVLDGPSMIRALRAIDANVRIVGSSGLTGLSDSTVWKDVGVRHWVSKPYKGNALIATLQRAMRGAD